MAISLKHTTQAVGVDAGNGEIGKTQWNEEHTLTVGTGKLVGRTTAGTGAAEEIAIGTGLAMANGTLSSTVTATPGGSTTQLQYNSNGTFAGATGLSTDGTSLTVTSGSITLSGNISAPAWTTNGLRHKSVAATLTDTSSNGTVAAAYTNVYGGNTIAASNATTFTDYYTTFINGPTAGTNVTFTRSWALGLGAGLQVNSTSNLGWSSDLFLSRRGAANLRLGQSDAASPVAQTLSVQSVVAGTSNTAGANLTITGSQGTGTGAGGSIIFKVAPAGSSGTAQNALATALTINSDKTITGASSIYVGGTTNTGISYPAANRIGFVVTALERLYIDNANGALFGGANTSFPFVLGNSNELRWSPNGTTASADLFIGRRAAANLRLGAADAAAPVAQTLSVQSVVAGTSNTAGANLTITGSQGTGTGAGGSIIFQVAPAGSTGSAQNALADALTITSAKEVKLTGNLWLGSAYVAGDPVTTGYITIYDSTGTAYKVPAVAA